MRISFSWKKFDYLNPLVELKTNMDEYGRTGGGALASSASSSSVKALAAAAAAASSARRRSSSSFLKMSKFPENETRRKRQKIRKIDFEEFYNSDSEEQVKLFWDSILKR